MKGAEYASNKGCGPLVARIIQDSGETLTVVRWNPRTKSPQRSTFLIGKTFFNSPLCGWKKIGGGT